MAILIGADPELFVYTVDGKPVSAHDLLPGNKYDPHYVSGGAVQVDGVAAEFNIDPAADEREFFLNIAGVEHQMLSMILRKNANYRLMATPTIKFTAKQWRTIPDEAKVLGCEPDYNAYTKRANDKPRTDRSFRTGSGHLHISWGDGGNPSDNEWMRKGASLVWHLDRHLYKNSLRWDEDLERQRLYGKPGAFRPKPYGIEYRTLSNAWLKDEHTIKYVFRVTKDCTEHWLAGKKPNEYTVEEYNATA